jgi:hypothetical protein
MITNFYLFERLNLDDTIIDIENNDMIKKLLDELSLVIYKRVKRNLRIIKISGYFDKTSFDEHKNHKESLINIDFSNKDTIEAKFISKKQLNEIEISINDEIVYDVENINFNEKTFIDKIIDEYKKYLKDNNWNFLN